MTQITQDRDIVTLINVFTVAPERQQDLLNVLVRATEEVIRSQPGFISANFHTSLDGRRVVNYAQWRSRADFDAMLAHPAAIPHLQEAGAIATSAEPGLYEVAFVEEAP